MKYIIPTTTMITLNVNSLNTLIKRQIVRVGEKKDLTICCLQEIHFKCKDSDRLEVKRWRKIYHTNDTNQKETGVTILFQIKETSEQGPKRVPLHNDKS